MWDHIGQKKRIFFESSMGSLQSESHNQIFFLTLEKYNTENIKKISKPHTSPLAPTSLSRHC